MQMLATLGTITSFVCALLFTFHRYPFRGPYFSGIFVLALCPFGCSALFAVLHVHYFLLNEALADQTYITGRLLGPSNFAIAGAWASLAALIVYSVAYACSAKYRHA